MSRAYLDIDALEALIPWREFEFSARQIAYVTAGFVGLILVAWLVDGGSLQTYLVGVAAMAVLLPLGILLAQRIFTRFAWTPPLALDRNRIVAPTIWGNGAYVPWRDVYLIAFVRSVLGRRWAPIEKNLLIFRKGKRPLRLSLPELSVEEFNDLAVIVERISALHGIEVVHDDDDAGQQRLRGLPWA